MATRALTSGPLDDPAARPARPKPGLLVALIGFAAGYLVAAAASVIADAATGYHPSSGATLPAAVEAADVAGLWVGLIGAVVFWSFNSGTRSLVRDFGLRVVAWWEIPLGAACGLIVQYGVIPLMYLPFEHLDRSLSHRLGQPTQKETAAASHGSAVALVVVVIVLAVGAPFVEELFFRGLVLRSLLARIPVPVALVADALIFGLAHFEPLQFAGLAIFGLVLAVLAWKTQRLASPISAHMAFNLSAVLTAVHLH